EASTSSTTGDPESVGSDGRGFDKFTTGEGARPSGVGLENAVARRSPMPVRCLAVSRPQIRPFQAADVPAASRLLAERHARHRQAEPMLSPRYEDSDACAVELTTALKQPDASGAVAFRDGLLVGYLLGAPKASPVWGPNVWVEAAGQALANDV